ncbi:OsmC family protein [Siminovitchia sediminis]|uniref:OsmC family protein n=1 Tax=Siminovitchia sediminis TaxID=1274353 RepID=A0ABW4KNZ4_9BACI
MLAAKTTHLRKIKVHTDWKGNLQTEHFVRGFQFIVDEPKKIGGDNEAPTPLEYVLGSFNGCLLVVIELVANECSFQYEDIEIFSTATVDRRGLMGTADVSPYYQTVENEIIFYSKESEERLEELMEIVTERCPVYNLLKNAGVEIQLNWTMK